MRAHGEEKARLEAAIAAEKAARAAEEDKLASLATDAARTANSDKAQLERQLNDEKTTRRTESERASAEAAKALERRGDTDAAAAAAAAAAALRAHNAETAKLEAAVAAEKEARRAEQVQTQWSSAAALSAANKVGHPPRLPPGLVIKRCSMILFSSNVPPCDVASVMWRV